MIVKINISSLIFDEANSAYNRDQDEVLLAGYYSFNYGLNYDAGFYI